MFSMSMIDTIQTESHFHFLEKKEIPDAKMKIKCSIKFNHVRGKFTVFPHESKCLAVIKNLLCSNSILYVRLILIA